MCYGVVLFCVCDVGVLIWYGDILAHGIHQNKRSSKEYVKNVAFGTKKKKIGLYSILLVWDYSVKYMVKIEEKFLSLAASFLRSF